MLLVFFVHYHSVVGEFAEKNNVGYMLSNCLGEIGHTGVDLFFVLSGYLIYGALIKKEVNLKSFYMKRIIRIYPTFTVVFILYIFLSYMFPSESKLPKAGLYELSSYLLKNFLLLPGIFSIKPMITVAWSLSYEIFYYLTIPLIITMLNLRNWKPINRIYLFMVSSVSFLYFCEIGALSRERIAVFMAGIVLYELVNVIDIFKSPPKFSSVAAILLFLFAVISYGELNSESYSLFFKNYQKSSALSVLILFFSFLLFVKVGLRETTLSRLLSFTPLRYLGNMSYSYYLIHGLTIKFVGFILSFTLTSRLLSGVDLWLFFPIVFLATLISSTLLFVFIEKPFSVAK